jgi:hypothetical protein
VPRRQTRQVVLRIVAAGFVEALFLVPLFDEAPEMPVVVAVVDDVSSKCTLASWSLWRRVLAT